MKTTTLAVAAIGLLQFTTAQPYRALRHAHPNKHAKRDGDVVITVVDTVYADATDAPLVVVYVNQFGDPVSTTTQASDDYSPSVASSAASSTIAPSSPSASSSSSSSSSLASSPSTSAASTPTTTAAAVAVQNDQVKASSSKAATTVATSAAQAQTSSAASSSSSQAASAAGGYGFAYSPYNSDSSCKTQDQVNTDFAAIPSGYGLVRIYGTDCNQVATVLSAAKSKGIKLFAGIFDLSTLSSEVETIVSAAKGDWSSFDTISIGNELVNSGTASAATVVAAIGTARGLLTAAGYTGRVVTVDTLVASRANPSLCDASDYCAVNSHPFFDGKTVAANSGSFLSTQIPTLQAVLSNKNQEIVITETGWPWQGETNGVAVPSVANQAAALSSIKSAFSSNQGGVILFSTFNDQWKTNTASQFNAEQYWGYLGNSPSG